ncbi:MAG: hypothetical protein JOY99_14610 [Sphingomonadaceae bacterium]|nr:hypothetical protein [Sphingomonadaceae bacterium]
MRRIDRRIDIDPSLSRGDGGSTAVTMIFDPDAVAKDPIVFFAWPGGGYNRRYFDLQLPGRPGYSQAEFHAGRGAIFVTCDHIGVGDSSIPTAALNHSQIAGINAATAQAIIADLRNGEVDAGLPPLRDLFPVAMGQSYGGLLLTHLQAEHRVFKGVAMLGWSGICTQVKTSSGAGNVPTPAEMRDAEALNDGLRHPYRRSFHFDDVPEEIVAEDLRGYPARIGVPVPSWGTPYMPGGPHFAPERGPLGPGVVVDEAAAIDVPVFIGNGEIDTVPDPRAEPAAYPRAPDITTMVLPRSSHMHNFAGTRTILWERLENWASGIRAAWQAEQQAT